MFEYLNDMDFLTQLDKLHMRVQYAKIILLSFKDEEPIKEIQGSITSGNLSVNGSSAIRRTITLTMLASIDNSNLEDIDNEISINKKIKVLIGYDNPLKSYKILFGFLAACLFYPLLILVALLVVGIFLSLVKIRCVYQTEPQVALCRHQ